MGNTLVQLKALYVALGGIESDVASLETTDAVLEKIVTVAGTLKAKANELPNVDATDNGKILKVANGKWAVGTDLTE